mmetsp:Transcript_10615/g.25646  ORF Transcript_10615/g.25646 Transcript_10615/m.25646 type:complete len:86 (-) Transcript_10615:71-328(-)
MKDSIRFDSTLFGTERGAYLVEIGTVSTIAVLRNEHAYVSATSSMMNPRVVGLLLSVWPHVLERASQEEYESSSVSLCVAANKIH